MLQMINKLESYSTNPGFIEVTNMGGFVASFSVSYNLNGQDFNKESGSFSLFFSKRIDLPANSTNIHVLVLIANDVDQWTPVYNNNWDNPGILKAKLYGTTFSPQLEVFSDSKPPKFKVSVTNNAGFVCRYILQYKFNNKPYSIEVGKFTLGITRNIAIPESAKDLNILIIENLDTALPEEYTIYTKYFSEASDLKFIVSGTTSFPKVDQLPLLPSLGSDFNSSIPLIKISKTPNKNQVALGEKITFTINISHVFGSTAKMLILSENLPPEATFVQNSFILNGTNILGNFLPTQGLQLNNININESISLSYEVIFNKLPSTNPVQDKPMLNYNYIDSKGTTQNTSIIGDIIPLNILNSVGSTSQTAPCTCCCCCCQLCNSNYLQYLYYMKSNGYI